MEGKERVCDFNYMMKTLVTNKEAPNKTNQVSLSQEILNHGYHLLW